VKRCKVFPSQEYAASKVRRLRRIAARAIPELSEAFAAGKVTLRQYDLISQLPATQQRARVAALDREIEEARIAAKVINEMLDGKKDLPRLSDISAAIMQAVQRAN
jgi:hypothetical protein